MGSLEPAILYDCGLVLCCICSQNSAQSQNVMGEWLWFSNRIRGVVAQVCTKMWLDHGNNPLKKLSGCLGNHPEER
jgi:hypothetical protein